MKNVSKQQLVAGCFFDDVGDCNPIGDDVKDLTLVSRLTMFGGSSSVGCVLGEMKVVAVD